MSNLSDFHTRKTANEGIKLPLTLPNGLPSNHFLMIRGIDSDEFREAQTQQSRSLLNTSELSDLEREKLIDDYGNKLICSLVIGWSFDEDFNQENLSNWLIESPQVADMVDRIASQRGLFIKKKLKPSKSTPSTTSKKPSPSKAQSTRKKRTPNKSKKP